MSSGVSQGPCKGFPGVQTVKNPPAMQETGVQFLGWEDPLEKGTATHSSILAREISWTEEPGSLQSMGSHRIRHNWSDLACTRVSAYEKWKCWSLRGFSLLHRFSWPTDRTQVSHTVDRSFTVWATRETP